MKKRNYKIILSALVVCIIVISCKTKKPLQNALIKNMPESFALSKDSLNSADIKWKDYFTNSNLTELIDISLKNNMDMSIAMQRIEVTSAGIRFSKNIMLPNINIGVSAAQRRFGLYTMDGAGNISTEITPGQIVPIHLPDYYLGLQTSWELDVWGKLRNKKKAAIARYLSSVEGKNAIVTNLIAELAHSYYELLALDNELEIISETINLQQNALQLITIQKQAGVSNELAVQQFQAQVFNSKAMEFEIQQRITESENKINYLLGRYPQTITRNKAELNNALPVKPNIGIPINLLKNRPDIKQAEYNLIASKADLKAAKAAFYPSLTINGNIGFQAFKTGLLFTNPQSIAYSLLGNLVAPLLNRNAIKTEFKTANALQQEALYNYQKTILNGYIEVYNEVARINNLEKIVDFKTKQANTLTQSIETSSDLFKTGRATYIEVLITQQGSLQTKLEVIEAKKRQYNAVIDIYKALGGGWK